MCATTRTTTSMSALVHTTSLDRCKFPEHQVRCVQVPTQTMRCLQLPKQSIFAIAQTTDMNVLQFSTHQSSNLAMFNATHVDVCNCPDNTSRCLQLSMQHVWMCAGCPTTNLYLCNAPHKTFIFVQLPTQAF